MSIRYHQAALDEPIIEYVKVKVRLGSIALITQFSEKRADGRYHGRVRVIERDHARKIIRDEVVDSGMIVSYG